MMDDYGCAAENEYVLCLEGVRLSKSSGSCVVLS